MYTFIYPFIRLEIPIYTKTFNVHWWYAYPTLTSKSALYICIFIFLQLCISVLDKYTTCTYIRSALVFAFFKICCYILNLWIRVLRYSNTYPVSSQSIWRFSGRYRWGSSKSSRTGSTKNEKKVPFESKTSNATLSHMKGHIFSKLIWWFIYNVIKDRLSWDVTSQCIHIWLPHMHLAC